MKLLTLSCALLIATSWIAAQSSEATPAAPAASAAVPAAGTTARQQIDEIKKLFQAPPPDGLSRPDYILWSDARVREIGEKALAVYHAFPNDPDRWEAVFIATRFQPHFITAVGPDVETEGEKAITFDQEKAAAWNKQIETLAAAMRAATDLPAEVREQLAVGEVFEKMGRAGRALHEGETIDFAPLEQEVDAFLAAWPESEAGNGLVSYLLQLREKSGHGDEKSGLEKYAKNPNRYARDYVAGRLRLLELSEKPLELAFTAVDGREVDVAKLRGKVVLIDFWATWCGPCIAEIPNLKEAYAKYHDKGFEVVGISLDNARDKQKLISFVEENGLVWPHFFDGKGWKNELATRYAITGIPAMFLLDKTGKVASTNARGEKVVPEIERLLAQ